MWNSGTASSQNSIFAGHTALQGPDFFGTLESEGSNLIENPSGSTLTGPTAGDLTGLDPRLPPPCMRGSCGDLAGGKLQLNQLELGNAAA